MKIIWLFWCLFLIVVSIDPSRGVNREQIRELLVKKINEFKVDLHRTIESRRVKRSVDGTKHSYSVQFDTSRGSF